MKRTVVVNVNGGLAGYIAQYFNEIVGAEERVLCCGKDPTTN